MRALPGKASRQPPGPPPVSRDKAAADQRRRILDATAELVAEKGYQGATIELIVRRAKVGYQTFYKSFEDKEAAFLVLVEEAIEGLEKRVKQAYEREREWPDQIAAGLGALFEEVAANPDVAHACLVEAITAGPKAAALQEGALKRFAPLLKPGRELNPRRAQLPDTLEDTLMGGVIWVVNQRLIAGEAEKLRALLPETLEFVLRPYVGEEVAAREAGTAAGASAG
ncbi:MAG TPA: TetR/AcrR family transcriptional regulator [Solirubrobacterales bacterium]|nr:TetR/AcrR family transcriptional regulator [Solirubrobacterales bacterium]